MAKPESTWHHAGDGLFFGRGLDGSVFLEKREDEFRDAKPIWTAVIPAGEWASIVAAVSSKGEDVITYAMAKEFHGEC